MRRIGFFLVLVLLVGAVVLATIGTSGGPVSFGSLLTLWSDGLRDTDQIGMRLTRLSDADEMRVGSELDRFMPRSTETGGDERYVADVAEAVLPHVRRQGIRYQFQVVGSSEINAFAMPGGRVFVTSGMLGAVESEAELAAVLGHEIAHVDLRHCVERYQYEYRLKKAGVPELGWMVELAHHIATSQFKPYQELEADTGGQALAIKAGYDPGAAAALFERMRTHFHEPLIQPATTPLGEVAQATANAVGSYFQTHPPYEERAQNLNDLVARNHRELKGRRFYVGKENFRRRTARAHREWTAEYRAL